MSCATGSSPSPCHQLPQEEVWPHQPAPPQEEAEVIYSPSAGAQSSTEEDKNVGAFFGGLLRRTRLIGSGKMPTAMFECHQQPCPTNFTFITLILSGDWTRLGAVTPCIVLGITVHAKRFFLQWLWSGTAFGNKSGSIG